MQLSLTSVTKGQTYQDGFAPLNSEHFVYTDTEN